MISIRLLAVATLLAASCAARADFILSMPDGAAHAGAPLRVDLTILNDSDAPLRLELPAQLRARLETDASRCDLRSRARSQRSRSRSRRGSSCASRCRATFRPERRTQRR